MQSKGKFALVGLPCHIHGVRKSEELLPGLKRRIAFRLGLFCINNARLQMTHYLLKRNHINQANVSELKYRDKMGKLGWPGGMNIVTQENKQVFIPYADYQYAQTLFSPRRCEVCPDFSNELADISLGDAHLKEFLHGRKFKSPDGHVLEGRKGWNCAIVRTSVGVKLWGQATRSGVVLSHQISADTIIDAQKPGIYYKKRSYFARIRLQKILGNKLPQYSGLREPQKLNPNEFLKPLISLLTHALLSTPHGITLLRMIPEKYLRVKLGLKQKLISRTLSA